MWALWQRAFRACLLPIMLLPSSGVRLMRKERPVVFPPSPAPLIRAVGVNANWSLQLTSGCFPAAAGTTSKRDVTRRYGCCCCWKKSCHASKYVGCNLSVAEFEKGVFLPLKWEPCDWCNHNLEPNQPVETQTVALSGVIQLVFLLDGRGNVTQIIHIICGKHS